MEQIAYFMPERKVTEQGDMAMLLSYFTYLIVLAYIYDGMLPVGVALSLDFLKIVYVQYTRKIVRRIIRSMIHSTIIQQYLLQFGSGSNIQ